MTNPVRPDDHHAGHVSIRDALPDILRSIEGSTGDLVQAMHATARLLHMLSMTIEDRGAALTFHGRVVTDEELFLSQPAQGEPPKSA